MLWSFLLRWFLDPDRQLDKHRETFRSSRFWLNWSMGGGGNRLAYFYNLISHITFCSELRNCSPWVLVTMSKSNAHCPDLLFIFLLSVCISEYFFPLCGARKLSSEKILFPTCYFAKTSSYDFSIYIIRPKGN